MKTDIVELVTEIEELFGIEIPQYEASRMATRDDILAHLVAKTAIPCDIGLCLSAVAFYRLRRAALRLSSATELRPSDSTSLILPQSGRKHFWSRLEQESRLSLPPLRRPAWLVRLLTLVLLICSAVFGVLVYRFTNSEISGVVAAFVMGIELGLLAAFFTRRLAVHPGFDCSTMRRLSNAAMKINFKSLSKSSERSNVDDPWQQFKLVFTGDINQARDTFATKA